MKHQESKRRFGKLVATALTATSILAACGPTSELLMPSQLGANGNLQTMNTGARPRQEVFNTSTKPQAIADEVIVKARNANVLNLLNRSGLRVIDSFEIDTPVYLVKTPTNGGSALMNQLKSNPDVEFSQPNYVISMAQLPSQPVKGRAMQAPNDPLFAQQWHLNRVNALESWSVTQGNPDLIVSVVDTGVDYNHPDLAGRVIKGKDYTKESDGTDPIDGFGHGTHVAGIINAMANNGIGVAGVAPNVKVMAVKVLSKSGGGSLFSIAGGIQYSVKNGAKIVNLSLGGPAVTDLISSAVGYWATKKGALLIAAAGNSANAVGTPARIDDYYMAVGASDENENLAKFSCFGKELSVVSPGTKIMATTPSYKVPLNDLGYPMNYAALQGTSMATPLVAGIAALVWSKHPEFTAKQVRAQIEKSAIDLGEPGKDNRFGHGRVNLFAALSN